MAAVKVLFSISALHLLYATSTYRIIDLVGQWAFYSANETVHGIGDFGAITRELEVCTTQCYWTSVDRCNTCRVPGDIFTDLHRANVIPDPLYGDNHLHLRWISAENWTYIKRFKINTEVLKFNRVILVVRGVDTVSTILVNGVTALRTTNQFVEYYSDVKKLLKLDNIVEVRFTSPVLYAKEQSLSYQKAYGHQVPPVCPPVIYNGECHPNFIRKAQYSFSWDWGPSIPTVGIWKPIQLIAFNEYFIDDFAWTTERTPAFWLLRGSVRIFAENKSVITSFRVIIEELGIDQHQSDRIYMKTNPVYVQFKVRVRRDKVNLWWPNGEGEQKLYNITVMSNDRAVTHRVGFRHVELIQDYVDSHDKQKGRHFFVRLNDRPLFLKGSNWIPVSMFLAQNNTERIEFLLDSVTEAGMNTLRVWGGGNYESEEFYEYADRKGILLWQDLMFACALYPTDKVFLSNIEEEVRQQIWRIRRHPSILLWAGNNENELAIRSHWWAPDNFSEAQQVKDYVLLYKDLIKPLVEAIDPPRPFLLSSPSNGVQTEQEGGVSQKPDDPHYGDIHFYNDFYNLWLDDSYQIPRCASEYGVQSLPFKTTMLKHINQSEWYYTSKQLAHRQHRPAGLILNLQMVFSHFPIPFQCPKTLSNLHQCKHLGTQQFIDRFAYFSQAHQATTYKVQTEHYRRYRNLLLPSGLGNTMCALYWQLNDVWAAPTWSTIDIDLNWKMAHYEARRFMAPVIVVIYASGVNDMGITVVNDLPTNISGATLQIDQLAWTNGFEPVYSHNMSIDINSLTAREVALSGLQSELSTSEADFLIRARLLNSTGGHLAPETVLLPSKLYEIDFADFGNVSITKVEKKNNFTYSILTEATGLSPYTWISVAKPILGWLSDNGFTMTVPSRVVTLHLRKAVELRKEDFSICNLKNCGSL